MVNSVQILYRSKNEWHCLTFNSERDVQSSYCHYCLVLYDSLRRKDHCYIGICVPFDGPFFFIRFLDFYLYSGPRVFLVMSQRRPMQWVCGTFNFGVYGLTSMDHRPTYTSFDSKWRWSKSCTGKSSIEITRQVNFDSVIILEHLNPV